MLFNLTAANRLSASIECLGMSSKDSQVLGKDVQAGSVGAENIDSATGFLDIRTIFKPKIFFLFSSLYFIEILCAAGIFCCIDTLTAVFL